ncbi:MAG: hypothetical protein ACRDGL_11305, partial [Candidatus Limnocylindrales bacterium]
MFLTLLQGAAGLAGLAVAASLFVWLRRDLERRDAQRRAQVLGGLAFVLAACAWLVVLVSPAPAWVAWLCSVPAAVVSVSPDVLVRLTGGSLAKPRLRHEVEVLRDLVGAPLSNETEPHVRALRARIAGLARWRGTDAATAELVDLVQEWAYDRLDGLPLEAPLEAVRQGRIDQLVAGLLAPAHRSSDRLAPPSGPAQAPPDEESHGGHDGDGDEGVEGLEGPPDLDPSLAQLEAGPD